MKNAMAVAGSLLVPLCLSGCGSSTLPANPVSAPTPPVSSHPPQITIDSVSPGSAVSGSSDLTLSISGTGFQSLEDQVQSIVIWSAAGRANELFSKSVTANQLTVVIPADLLIAPLTAQVTVENGDFIGIADGVDYPKSNSITFTVTAPPNANSAFTLVGSMSTPRDFHTATPLPDGRVLVAGGAVSTGNPDCETALKTAELFDPQTLSFTGLSDLTEVRYGHTATLLADGTVLITGGGEDCSPGSSSTEIFDPSTGKFRPATAMKYRRTFHTATQLEDGRVLVAGGLASYGGGTAEVYNPSSGQFSAALNMMASRAEHTAVRLQNGQVFFAGGYDSSSALASAEIYDPASSSFRATGSMSIPRILHTATVLLDGRVLTAGGTIGNGSAVASAEIYDPATGVFSRTGSMQVPRLDHRATLLPDGRVLITGGNLGAGSSDSAELFDPSTNQFSMLMQMSDFRDAHTATLLDSRHVLLIGGGVVSAEMYLQPQ